MTLQEILHYIFAFALFSLFPLGAGALWYAANRRRIRKIPYRKRMLRGTVGGLALLGIYTLSLLAVLFSVGYIPSLSAMAPNYMKDCRIPSLSEDDLAYLTQYPWMIESDMCGILGNAWNFNNALLKVFPLANQSYHDYQTEIVASPMDLDERDMIRKKIPRPLLKLYQLIENIIVISFNTAKTDYSVLEDLEFLIPKQTPGERFKSLLSDLFECFVPYVRFSPTPEDFERSLAMRYFEDLYGFEFIDRKAAEMMLMEEQFADMSQEELDEYHAAKALTDTQWYRRYAKKYLETEWGRMFLSELDLPEEDKDKIFLLEYEPLPRVMAVGYGMVENYPEYELRYVRIHEEYSPLAMALNAIKIPLFADIGASLGGTGYKNFEESEEKSENWLDLPLGELTATVTTCFYVFLLCFLLFQTFRFSRHERREAQRRAKLLLDVAHELKTPMGSVMLKGEEVLEGETMEDKERSAEEMLIQIERMRDRLNEVLQNARLESMGVRLHIEKFSLREAMEDAADQVADLADAKRIALQLPQGGDIEVMADRTYIVRAVFNYLTNAVKYAPIEGQIVCGLRRAGRNVLCSVYNSGSHIPKRELKKIWQQFYKVGDGGDNAEKGTGVGLSTVKSILTLHGGDCGCKNMADGIEFWFRIPIRLKGGAADRIAAAYAPHPVHPLPPHW